MRFVLPILAIIIATIACTIPPTATPIPTPTPTPILWYSPAEITEVYQSHRTRAHVMFETGTVYIQSVVAELHPSKPGLVYLVERRKAATDMFAVLNETDADRAAKDWKIIRATLPVEQVANLNIGDSIHVRCNGMGLDENVGTGSELICKSATLLQP